MKPIRLSGHARENMVYRGTSEEEIFETISTAHWTSAERGRSECSKEFDYKKVWNNKYYPKKQIRPIFIEHVDEIIVVTVYVYYY